MFKHRQLLSLAFVMTFAVSGVYAMGGGGAAGAAGAGDDDADVVSVGLVEKTANLADKINGPANFVLDKAADLAGGVSGLLKDTIHQEGKLAAKFGNVVKLSKAGLSAWVAYLLVTNEKVNEKLSSLSQALKRSVGLGKCDAGSCTKSGVCTKAQGWDKKA